MGANESQAFVTIAQDPYPPLNNSPNTDHSAQMNHACMNPNQTSTNSNLNAINSAYQMNIVNDPLDVAVMSNGNFMQMQQQQQQIFSLDTSQMATASGVNVYQNLKKEYISNETDENSKNNYFQYNKSMNFHAQPNTRFQTVNFAKQSSASISANGSLDGLNVKGGYSNRMFSAPSGFDASAKEMHENDEDSKNIGLIKNRLLLAGSEADKKVFFDANM